MSSASTATGTPAPEAPVDKAPEVKPAHPSSPAHNTAVAILYDVAGRAKAGAATVSLTNLKTNPDGSYSGNVAFEVAAPDKP